MNEAKIRLSSKEMDLVTNADWILTKNAILQKTKGLLEELLQKQQIITSSIGSGLPSEVIAISPKISRGENYRGLPYLVLDYPRYFDKENVFAIRTMFWWGNFFSSTLHLSGHFKQKEEHRIIAAYSSLADSFICTGENEWEHHFEKENYLPIGVMEKENFSELVLQKDFIKLAYRVPLQQWDNALPLLEDHFNSWLKLLAD